MSAVLPSLLATLCLAAAPVETKFVQVVPAPRETARFERSPGQRRAVVLIHGLSVQPFVDGNAARAEFRSWQRADGHLARALAPDADVYAFAYGQDLPVQEVAGLEGFTANVRRLKELGYREIVLVGHSAGGLVARQFVEDYPDSGVTKVVQVCAPNAGSSWARAAAAVGQSQEAFLASLTREGRRACLKCRADKKVPEHVQFVCLVGTRARFGDGVVSCDSQWPDDLQEQGIPAVALAVDHLGAVRGKEGARRIAALVGEDHERWSPDEVRSARRRIFGK